MSLKKLADDFCNENPLGILCRCSDYKIAIRDIKISTIGTTSPIAISKIVNDVEPATSDKVIWIAKRTEKYRESEEPFILNFDDEENIEEKELKSGNRVIDERSIPVKIDVVSPKYIRPNDCHLRQSHLNTQSAVRTTLTDMLPHRGRVVKRKDIPWAVGTHKTPNEMTDDIETRWGRVSGCFTPWANAFTISMSCPPY